MLIKRSITIKGHPTSISLENSFWEELNSIANARKISLASLVAEIDANSSFFPPDYIPKRFCSGVDSKGIRYPVVADVVAYLTESTLNMFEDDQDYNKSCMSLYNLCE